MIRTTQHARKREFKFRASALFLAPGALLLAGMLWSTLASASQTFTCHFDTAKLEPNQTVKTELAGVPAILRVPRVVSQPPIILWHGFGPPASAETLMQDLPLDGVPAIKVYLDLPLFGQRAPQGGVDELLRRQRKDFAGLVFKPIVMGAAQELPAVVAALERRDCMRRGDPIGLFGFSAGGAAALIALAQHHVPVSVAVTVSASTGLSDSVEALERMTHTPYRWTSESRRIAEDSDAIPHAAQIAAGSIPVALLLIQGAKDSVVAPAETKALYKALWPYYRHDDNTHRLKLIIASGVPHAWASSKASAQIDRSIGIWFDKYLGAAHLAASSSS